MTLLLVVIYITFISLGLPDSLFGVTWPLVHLEFEVAESFGSLYSVVIALTTGGVSFFAGVLIRRFGTGKVTAVSIFLTVVSLVGISFSPNIVVLLLFSILGGLGAGAIDTGLNNFVSIKYKAIHMNWLHCFWGVGVCVSPLIMSVFLKDGSWRSGYAVIGFVQTIIAIIVFLSLVLWKKYDTSAALSEEEKLSNVILTEEKKKITVGDILKTKGLIFGIFSLGFYCAMEFLLGTWGASYLINARNFTADLAALFVSFYYGGIMFGRFVSGILSLKLSDKILIRGGSILSGVGIAVLFLPFDFSVLIGFLFIGVGFGPVFPSSLHAVPERFGKEKSADITGYMMGGAYAIGFLIQVIFGYTATAVSFSITPVCLILFFALLLFFSELTNVKTKKI